jgi:hypothetical protein
VEVPPPSERAAVVGRNDDRESVRNGIRVDGKRQHQPVCEGKYRHGSVGTRMLFVQSPYLHLSLIIKYS